MSEFDLIPEDYKYWQWQKTCMKRTAIVVLICSVLVLILTVYFRTDVSRQEALVMDLQRDLSMAKIQQEQRSNLVESEQLLQAHWDLLEELRGGARVESAMATVDESLSGDDVWFLNLRFQRIVQRVDRNGATQPNTYVMDFINHQAGNQAESWSIDTQVSITGQARDHSAFSAFVQRLDSSRKVLEVKIARTSLATINDISIVEFNIQVLMNNSQVLSSG